jgi:hypothetical protein
MSEYSSLPGLTDTLAAATVAVVAGDIQHRETGGNLAKDDDTSGHGRILVMT